MYNFNFEKYAFMLVSPSLVITLLENKIEYLEKQNKIIKKHYLILKCL